MRVLICDVSPEHDRFDVLVGDTLYRLAAIHGEGGVIRGNANHLRVRLRRYVRSGDGCVLIQTQETATSRQSERVLADHVDVLAHYPRRTRSVCHAH